MRWRWLFTASRLAVGRTYFLFTFTVNLGQQFLFFPKVPVTVCMPKNAPITKISNCQKLGARVILHGDHLQEARVKALEIGENENLIYVNGFDDPYVIAGLKKTCFRS